MLFNGGYKYIIFVNVSKVSLVIFFIKVTLIFYGIKHLSKPKHGREGKTWYNMDEETTHKFHYFHIVWFIHIFDGNQFQKKSINIDHGR